MYLPQLKTRNENKMNLKNANTFVFVLVSDKFFKRLIGNFQNNSQVFMISESKWENISWQKKILLKIMHGKIWFPSLYQEVPCKDGEIQHVDLDPAYSWRFSSPRFPSTQGICTFFFLDGLRKFTISDFPMQTHLGYTLITLFFSYTL